MMTLAEAALTYASWGWRVLPVAPGAKIPATRHGVHDATTDPEQIRRWWRTNPNFNVGIACGEGSGIICLDVDPRNGGDTAWSGWIGEHGPINGSCALTAGGGEHHLVVWQPGLRSCKLDAGIDLLADGRYFVAWPSIIGERSYQWEASADPLDGVGPQALPARWLAAIQSRLSKARERATVLAGSELISGGRNSGLTALAGSMRRHGMTEAEILAALQIANETRCDIPLPVSEIQSIARSVARYEPEVDAALDAAVGSEAAEAMLQRLEDPPEYYMTRASAYLGQPAPIGWVVKRLIPADATTMLLGESGSGKSFTLLDLLCHVAAGKQWMGAKTRSGIAVLLVGEGHWGTRQRVAAWAKHHQVGELDRLLISNKAIDIDSPAAAAQVIAAVRELEPDGQVVAVGIDTLNTHMSGNENDARDTRAMMLACSIVSRALQCATILVHHSGHAVESKHRARGSSAWRASLDASYVVSREDDGLIKIECSKMKDAEMPQPIFGRLQSVDLGWIDEDGEVIAGAVFVREDNQPEKSKTSQVSAEIKKITNAWWHGSAELLDGQPYVTRQTLIDYLVEFENLKPASASVYCRETAKGKLIYNLLNAQIIQGTAEGWVVIDPVTASSMLIRRAER